ncbi:GntR family transcriptional regulator [Marinomonas profundimaris]|uniref:GntR family transcriptional regulator n=1 Tax=Marinomonas profundimaris TaxID=1208321 RepID=W1RZ59_9GAMM|nr:GntR family transcriptional regulator [Marinomonas profundimaris]ETI60123.1 GntR family transcriptional regulator [Marinomonas profundimaris]
MNVITKIKEDILSSELPRGVPLRQTALSVRYGVSRIPIRDALSSLKSEGWLVSHGKVGVMIPSLNWKEAEDLSLMRAELECLLFEMAFDDIGEDNIKAARKYLFELGKESLTLVCRGELNWHFHNTLYEVANRPTLQRVVEGLNKQAVRYLGFQYGPLSYRSTSQDEHEVLLSLIEAKNKKAAVDFLRRHIEIAGKLLTDYLKRI